LHRRLVVAAIVAATVVVSASVSAAALAPRAAATHVTGQALERPLKPRVKPLVIAHRGASAYRAEHTLEAYLLAIGEGADFVEADLVVTKDRQLVARHEDQLSTTTDVARHPEFASRRRAKLIGGERSTNWFAEDFTLAELKTLRALSRGPLPPGVPQQGPGSIPSLAELIAATRQYNVGLYLELKTPAYFAALGLDPEPLLVAALRQNYLPDREHPVFVESFDAPSLMAVHLDLDVPLIQLLPGALPTDPAKLATLRSYASGVGLDRAQLRPLVTGASGATDVVATAHRSHLEVHVFTFSNTTVAGPFQAADYRAGDPPSLAAALAEYRAYYAVGVDGVFTDNPDVARQARAG
jgi:glycerophosphoryl diester phosphodiesterase